MKKIILAGLITACFVTTATYSGHTQKNILMASGCEEYYQQDTAKKYSDTTKYKMKKWKDSTSKKWMNDSLKRKYNDTIRKDMDSTLRKP